MKRIKISRTSSPFPNDIPGGETWAQIKEKSLQGIEGGLKVVEEDRELIHFCLYCKGEFALTMQEIRKPDPERYWFRMFCCKRCFRAAIDNPMVVKELKRTWVNQFLKRRKLSR